MSAMTALCVMSTVVVPSSRWICLDRLEHEDAGLAVERAGRLVAQQDRGSLGDGARNGDALLLAAGELRREVMQPVVEPDQLQRHRGVHGLRRDLGDEGDVLQRGQARDQVVELEDEADVLAPVGA